MQQKIQFIATIVHDPEILILDEPFSGLDPINVALMRDYFLEFRARGKTIIFCTHVLEQAEKLCDEITLMARSKKILEGSLKELKRRYSQDLLRIAMDASLEEVRTLPGVASAKAVDGTFVVALVPGHRPARVPAPHPRPLPHRRVLAEGAGARGDLHRRRPERRHRRTGRSSEARMNWRKTFAVVRREYVERVRTKSFWIATLLIPILFLGYVAIQISISRKTGGERQIVVVDQTGKLYAPLVKELADTEAKQKADGLRIEGPALDRSSSVRRARTSRRRRTTCASRSWPRRSTDT